MKALLLVFFIITCSALHAQTVLLQVDRKVETVIPTHGPNLKKFGHFYFRGGSYVSADKAGARIIYGPSVNLAFGLRTKYKIGTVYSIGYEIENQYSDFKFKQEVGKIIPDTIINDMGRLDYSSLVLGIFNRFNFDPGRGNFLGKFFDIGIAGEWHYSIKYIQKNDGADGSLVKVSSRNLNYTHSANAKLFARLGFSHFSLFASYRLTNLFKSSYNYPDLPRIAAGIDIAVF